MRFNLKTRRARLALERLEDRLAPATITVTGSGDTIAVDGVVTLREALTAANINAPAGDAPAGDPGLDTIRFNLDPSSLQINTANLVATEPVVIDGTTQPGFAGTPLIHLRPLDETAVADALGLNGGSSTVRGLDIEGFSHAGLVLFGQGGNVITGNQILFGLDGILIQGSSNNIIGGTTAADRNTLYGNQEAGINIGDPASTGNQVLGNFIGNAAGAAALGNETGIVVRGSGNLIGTTAVGAGNIISGNGVNGVVLSGPNNRVLGNLIGTDGSGMGVLGNHGAGVLVTGAGNIIGGTVPQARNVISGNSGSGVALSTDGNVVEGNFIGTDATGMAALGNALDGVSIGNGASGNTIGGTAAGARNVISGNARDGVLLQGSGTSGNLIQGNFIGTDALGTSNLGNGAEGVEIRLNVSGSPSGNTIGGTDPGAGNIISGNADNGILIRDGGATGNLVQGNFIGTDATGAALGNNGAGVAIAGGAAGNTIGGTAPGAGNTIAFNQGKGVAILSGSGNRLSSNAIFSNTGLGIDLNNNGVTANDPGDADTGANHLQNFPVLLQASTVGGNTVLSGTLNSLASTSFRIELFSNTAGQTYLGFVNVTTDGNGNASFSFTANGILPAATVFTATATNQGTGDTSEFSAAFDANHRFVQALYLDVLQRPGGSAEVDAWVTLLPGIGQVGVANGIIHSYEALTREVNNVYVRCLGRAVDPGGLAFWVGLLQGGKTLEEVTAGVIASPEFATHANTLIGKPSADENFVRGLYQLLLGRTPDNDEVARWLGRLSTSQHGAVAMGFLTGTEFRDQVVRALYGDPSATPPLSSIPNLLHRQTSPTAAEEGGWVNSSLDWLTLEVSFASGDEFFSSGGQ
jgi:parallel beta-helix repeat protein